MVQFSSLRDEDCTSDRAQATGIGSAGCASTSPNPPPSMPTEGRRRSNHDGSHQLASPISFMVAGTRTIRTTVAHHVSAIAVQAQAGREMAKVDPSSAIERLAVIEAEATKTLREMRAMVGALRSSGDLETAPRRGIGDLNALATTTESPLAVDVEVDGSLKDLEPAVDSAIYRLAQESLTNSIRHAMGAKRVRIQVSDGQDWVHLRVEDDGVPAARQGDTGYGLIGMQERTQLLGGTFRAGPSPTRGWVVEATLPKSEANR